MLEKSQEILRIALALGAVLIGGSVAYHYAIYIPDRDQKAQASAAAKEAEAQRKDEENSRLAEKSALERRTSYRICLSTAQANYDSRWESSCRSAALEAQKERADCVARNYPLSTCESYYPIPPDHDCRLPNKTANDYDEQLRLDKERCLSEVKSGLVEPL